MRRGRCWRRPGWSCPSSALAAAAGADRGLGGGAAAGGAVAGRAPGPGAGSRPGFPAASGRWPSTCWPRCSERQPRAGPAAAVAHFGPGAGQRGAGGPADRAQRRGSGSCRSWSRRARSWSRWTRSGPGSAITGCSPTCCSSSCGRPSRMRSRDCTRAAAGWLRRARVRGGGGPARPGRAATGTWPAACWRPLARPGPHRAGGCRARAAGRLPRQRGRRRRGADRAAWRTARSTGNRWRRPNGILSCAGGRIGVGARGPARRVPGLLLAVQRLRLARAAQRPSAAAEAAAQELMALAEVADVVQQGLGEDVRAMALVRPRHRRVWSLQRFDEAERHLEQGDGGGPPDRAAVYSSSAAWRMGPGLGGLPVACRWPPSGARRRSSWPGSTAGADAPGSVAAAYTVLAMVRMTLRGQLEEGERWLEARRAHAADRSRTGDWAAVSTTLRGALELARGRYADALAAFEAAGQQAETARFAAPARHADAVAHGAYPACYAGETEAAEQALAGLDEQQRETGEMRTAVAALRLAQARPAGGARAALAPVLDGSVSAITPARVGAHLLEAIGTRGGRRSRPPPTTPWNGRSTWPSPMTSSCRSSSSRAPELLERHARRCTAHAALVGKILALLIDGSVGPAQGGPGGTGSPRGAGRVRQGGPEG